MFYVLCVRFYDDDNNTATYTLFKYYAANIHNPYLQKHVSDWHKIWEVDVAHHAHSHHLEFQKRYYKSAVDWDIGTKCCIRYAGWDQ